MSVKFQDYYETLGVARSATSEEISKAFRKLARKYHPDVNKDPDAENRFKQINEANEVLGDPEKRKRYDALGANWQNGQEFVPPDGWEEFLSGFGGGARSGRRTYSFQTGGQGGSPFQGAEGFGGGGFSDFFNSLFGEYGIGAAPGGGARGYAEGSRMARAGRTHEAEVMVTLEEVYRQATKAITFEVLEQNESGVPERSTKSYQVKIPAGIVDGKTIRLAGQGGKGSSGAPSGDLLLRIKFAPHARFRADGHRLHTTLKITPWEAALGGKVRVPTLDGAVTLTIPAGTQSGQQLRIKGKGLPLKDGTHDNLLAEVAIVVPKSLTAEERELFEKLQRVSQFTPRGDHE
ncbi:MAG: DnaJ domain-containing protein [Bdellovibrionales bacterium]|nr:DnaJ domain-containing protein [Bdellovibrionales bacterium]